MKKVRIVYCKPCGYFPEASSLKRFLESYDVSVELVAGTNGVFDVYFEGRLVFSKFIEKRFPSPGEIKEAIAKVST